MRVVFLGTPDFSLPSLQAIVEARHEVVAVVSQPDRAKDRKGNLLPTPVKKAAQQLNLPVYQFEKIRRDGIDTLKSLKPDIMVTAAYGQILSKEVLEIAKYGVINVHASLLPKYRGSAPIQWAIINGEKETGVTIMQTEEGLDTGDILNVVTFPISLTCTSGELFDLCKTEGAKLLVKTMEQIERGVVRRIPQDHSQSTKCSLITKETARIDFSGSCLAVHNLIRGLNPKPAAYTTLNNAQLKIYGSSPTESERPHGAKNGQIVSAAAEGIFIACGEGVLKVTEVQLESKNRMSVQEFLKGYHICAGTVLGD